MAMRITTKMMQSTSLRNLNINKSRQEKLTNQMSTGKKITRPSDDPVIAIRSLKLNSSLDKIDQYYEKNASDAQSWLELTQSALSTVNEILTNDVRPNIIKAQNSYMTASDRKAVITHLRNAMAEIYSTGNADSGGRTIFTGYRTDMPLTMTASVKETNRITEQITNADLHKMNFVYAGELKDINEGNFMQVEDITKDEVSTNEIYRKRLAYGDVDATLDENGNSLVEVGYMTKVERESYLGRDIMNAATVTTGSVSAYVVVPDNTGEAEFTIRDKDGNVIDGPISVSLGSSAGSVDGLKLSYKEDGTIEIYNKNTKPPETVSIGSTIVKEANGREYHILDDQYKTTLEIQGKDIYRSGSNEAYLSVVKDDNKISLIAETGEILFGKNIAERLMALPSDAELRVTYEKTTWKEYDLDPVHYFYTERDGKTASGKDKQIIYNDNFLKDPTKDGKQIIEYDVGNNQTIKVNTTADEAFNHSMGRDMEEVISMLEEYESYEESLNAVKSLIASEKYDTKSEEGLKLVRQKEALEEAMTRLGDKINKRCQELINDCDGYFAKVQLAETDCGARLSRLRMVQNRLEMQQTNFGELVSQNEDADYTDLVIQLKSIEMTYQAALSSISYTMQTSLLDFIR